MTAEVVLPNGQFANIRPVLVRDVCLASSCQPQHFIAALIARTVTLDDEELTLEEVLDMEYENCLPIYEVIGRAMKHALVTRQGVA